MEVVKLVTPVAKAVFPHLDAHEEYMGQSTGKYSLTLEFAPDAIKGIKKVIAQVGQGKGTNPLKEIAADAEYSAGMFRLKAKSKFPVTIKDKAGKSGVDPSAIANGSEVRAIIGFAPYSTGANQGVTVYLDGVQLLSGGGGELDFGELPEGYTDFDDPLPF